MNHRPLGRHGIDVSEIGFGAWGIGGRTDGETSYGDTDDALSLAALHRALERGITFFDTSCVYGHGHSEELIGRAFAGRRSDVVIATKVGYRTWDAIPDFSPAAIVESTEGSLRRLRTDYVDLLQLHNPPVDALQRAEVHETLSRLMQAGKIRLWGVSAKAPADASAMLQHCDIPVVQVNLNMMDVRAAESGLLDEAARRGTGIIARTPLCFGFLSGNIAPDAAFAAGDHRRRWSRAQIERWTLGARMVLAAAGPKRGASATQAALRFCLSFPQVSSVIPGMLAPGEVDENAAASAQGKLDGTAVTEILEINRRSDFFVASPSA